MIKEILYRCEFCSTPFTSEAWFLRHKCKNMLREKQFISPPGQAAWNYYKYWMKAKHKTIISNANAFKKSKYFNTFYKFTIFVKKTNLPDAHIFIDLMVQTKIDPNYWTTAVAYRKYLEYMSRQLSSHKLAKITIKTLFDLAEAGAVDVSEVFTLLTPNEVIQLLHQRKLSPWVLLNSKKFAQFYINHTNTEEKIIMESIINTDYWHRKFKKNPKDVTTVKKYIEEMGL